MVSNLHRSQKPGKDPRFLSGSIAPNLTSALACEISALTASELFVQPAEAQIFHLDKFVDSVVRAFST
jgi:hypothetical protein